MLLHQRIGGKILGRGRRTSRHHQFPARVVRSCCIRRLEARYEGGKEVADGASTQTHMTENHDLDKAKL